MKRWMLGVLIVLCLLSAMVVIAEGQKQYRVNVEKCIGCTLCEQKCPIKAISMQEGKAVIDAKKCIGCGICANVCPTKAIAQETAEKAVNDAKPTQVLADSTQAVAKKQFLVIPDKCIGCTICVQKCPVKAIVMEKGKAVIDAQKCIQCGLCVQQCPVKAIEEKQGE